jgi:ABC-2 type transport system ATP-binding protein
MSAPMIEIEDLRKDYGDTQALRGVSFQVPRGQVVGFLGPNGAGKSTAMKILTGFVAASSGRVRVAGVDVAEDPVTTRSHIGYLAESNPLYDEMMVQEYLEFVAEVRQIAPGERDAKIQSAAGRCGLEEMLGRDIGQLSKGYRQRVGLAQAIVHDPDLLILDEPTTGLDPNQVVEIRSLIRELGREKTVLMSTHVLPEVQATCSRVLIISDGQVVADDAPESLVEEGGQIDLELAARAGQASASDAEAWLSALPGVQEVRAAQAEESGAIAFTLRASVEDPRTAIFDAAVEHGLVILRLGRRRVSLEEIFRRLTTSEAEPEA